MSEIKEQWIGQYQAFNEALKYMVDRASGKEKSIYTPWPKFNDATTDGLEWNTLNVIGGRPGCLSGDSILYIARKGADGSGRWYTLKDIYYKFNNLRHDEMHFRGRGWNIKIDSQTQSYKADQKLTGLNKILNVYESGIKKLYEVTTISGKKIKTTLDHPFLTDYNATYKKLKELVVGSEIACKADKKIAQGRQKRPRRSEFCSKMPYYPSARKKIVSGIEYHRIARSRMVYDAWLNNMSLVNFIQTVKTNPSHNLIFSDLNKEMHHVDFIQDNNIPSNLQLLTVKEHHKIHNDRSRLGLNNIQLEKITSIEYVGEEMTYDISMQDPYNNFIANGFVVHNSGKTLIKDQIIRESFILNPHDDFRVLEFQFEMVGRTSAIREFSSMTGKTYKELCSAGSIIAADVINTCHQYAKERIKYPVDIISRPMTVNQMREQVDMYFNLHKGKKTIITLDHTILVKRAPYQNNTLDMLFELGEFFTQTKREYPCLFITLSQLNRNIDNPERNIDGKYGNYILESDIFGSDAMLQHADTLIGINRPAKQKIRFYGPDRYIIDDDRTLVLHFLKARNGDTRMSFFKAHFEKMEISEMLTPNQHERR